MMSAPVTLTEKTEKGWVLLNRQGLRLIGMPVKATENAAWDFAYAMRVNLDVYTATQIDCYKWEVR